MNVLFDTDLVKVRRVGGTRLRHLENTPMGFSSKCRANPTLVPQCQRRMSLSRTHVRLWIRLRLRGTQRRRNGRQPQRPPATRRRALLESLPPPSLQAAAPTERHSVRRLLPNRRPTDAILLQSCSVLNRCWISGFSAGPCSICARGRDRVLWIRRKGLSMRVAVQRGQTVAFFTNTCELRNS